MADFFTSDPHFGHARIISLCNRPFDTVEQMNCVLIENWNSVVKPGDNVYLLGDVFLAMTTSEALAIREKLNGNIHLVLGNHDDIARKIPQAFCWTKGAYLYTTKTPFKIAIYLSHYAHRSWPKSHRGAWHLYGHSHGELPNLAQHMSTDVGVDCWNYTPVSLDQVIQYMDAKRCVQETASKDTLAWLDRMTTLASTAPPWSVASVMSGEHAEYYNQLSPQNVLTLLSIARANVAPEEFRSPNPDFGVLP